MMPYGGAPVLDDPELFEQGAEVEVEVVENDAAYHGPRERTSPPFPSEPPAGFESWRAFFQDAKEQVRARKERPTNAPVQPIGYTEIDPLAKTTPLSIRKLAKTVADAGWLYSCRRYEWHVPDRFYVGDSAVTGARAGDLKEAAHDEASYALIAAPAAGQGKVGFKACWAATKTGASFDFVQATDPVGVLRELYADYKAGKAPRLDKRETAESVAIRQRQMDELAERASCTYNTGETYLERHPLFKAAGEFNEWLEEWIALTAPKAEIAANQEEAIAA
ncbi:hypothetical protein [Agromyces sp. NPDC058104]|uniref:hypothetical protein n=1 Tax=Agromyces sp. NPDC058104 TaxID=3346342 RepID=UPI0036DAB2FA